MAFANPFDLYPWKYTPDGYTLIKGRSDLLAVANYAVAGQSLDRITATESASPAVVSERVVGTISEFDVSTLVGNVNPVPFNNSPVEVCPAPGSPLVVNGECIDPSTLEPVDTIPTNATIGGCLSFLFGPIGLAFDQYGYLFVVNEFGATIPVPGLPFNHAPTFVTVYAPGAFDDSDAGLFVPVAIIGFPELGTTGGDFG